MANLEMVETIREKYLRLLPVMGERMRRHWAAAEALALGRGGLSAVAKATGLSRTTLRQGVKELEQPAASGPAGVADHERSRRPGGGRKPVVVSDRSLIDSLDLVMQPGPSEGPPPPLRWTCESTRAIAERLQARGHRVSERTVAKLLREQGYDLQQARRNRGDTSAPDRGRQFEHINAEVVAFQSREQPVVSLEARRVEPSGSTHHGPRPRHPHGGIGEGRAESEHVPDRVGHAPAPDPGAHEGWLALPIDDETVRFAVEALARWWRRMGSRRFPGAHELLIVADCCARDSGRDRRWKVGLQALADRTGLEISVCQFPAGTSRWNRIDHRLLCSSTEDRHARPRETREVVVNLIGGPGGGPRTPPGPDADRPEEFGVSDEELAAVRIRVSEFQGNWNYTVTPRSSP
jgi:hypothetical protein